jgi:hypothetical protein
MSGKSYAIQMTREKKESKYNTSSSPPKQMRLSIQHPIIQTPLVRLIEEQVEVLECLGDPERL